MLRVEYSKKKKKKKKKSGKRQPSFLLFIGCFSVALKSVRCTFQMKNKSQFHYIHLGWCRYCRSRSGWARRLCCSLLNAWIQVLKISLTKTLGLSDWKSLSKRVFIENVIAVFQKHRIKVYKKFYDYKNKSIKIK